MTLIIETGAGVAGANSYASVAAFRAAAALRGDTLPDDDTKCEALLIRALQKRMRGLDYRGQAVDRDQPLDFPRTGVVIDGFGYASSQIPHYLPAAQIEYALAEQTTDLAPVIPANQAGPVVTETVGPLTTVFAPYGGTGSTARVPAADRLLSKLLRHTGISVVRA
jgi:hypothetical protein